MAAIELLEKLVTYAEYKALDVDDNYLYELLDGELVQKSAPSPRHQKVLAELYNVVKAHVKANQLGTVLFAPSTYSSTNTTPPSPTWCLFPKPAKA